MGGALATRHPSADGARVLAPSREKTSLDSGKIIGAPSRSGEMHANRAALLGQLERSHMAIVGWRSATRLIKRPEKKNGFDRYLISANISFALRKYDLLLLPSCATEMKLPGTEIPIGCHSWILAHELPILSVDELVTNRDRIDTKALQSFKSSHLP